MKWAYQNKTKINKDIDIDKIYKDAKNLGKRRLSHGAQPKCQLHGLKDEKLHTMTCQNTMLGVTTIEFEMEPEIREKHGTDVKMQRKLLKIKFDLYKKLIVPFWKERESKDRINPNLVKKNNKGQV